MYTKLVDKYAVRGFIKEKLGEEYLIPLLGVWDDPEKIDFESLPQKFVLKCNHNSGTGMCICKNKATLDINKTKKELKKGMEEDYYLSGREWPYKNVPRKIIAEQYMVDESGCELKDYKFMCFGGKVKSIFVCSERFSGEVKVTFFDTDWNKMPFERHYKASDKPIPKPEKLSEMIALAEKVAENIPFVRVDFYYIKGKIYFGEMTFYPGSGLEEFKPEEWDLKMGKLINEKR